jgi:competence protein ComEA
MTSGDERPTNEPSRFRPVLRRLDQATVAVITTISLLLILASYVKRYVQDDRLIEIDRSEPLVIEYKIDINRAPWPEFALLPDVGETLARRIVESRERDGPFLDHDDLRRVRGIGPKTLESMKPYLLPLPGGSELAGESRSQTLDGT